jgi:hypothetical protein
MRACNLNLIPKVNHNLSLEFIPPRAGALKMSLFILMYVGKDIGDFITLFFSSLYNY